MCPACMATVALLITGAVSTGGVAAAFAAKIGRKKRTDNEQIGEAEAAAMERSNQDVDKKGELR